MLNKTSKFLFIILASITLASAQTQGVLTCSFLPVTQTSGYQIPRNVLAVWIQDSIGGFVKTKLRYVGGGTNDHLPAWAVNSGGPSNNALSALCNRVDATAGATLPSFSAKSFTWDGKGVNGTVNGTVVPDGTYKVTLQQTWGHLSNQTALYSYTFYKGPCDDLQTPPDNTNITGVRISWKATLVDTCGPDPITCNLSPSVNYTCSTAPPPNLVGLTEQKALIPIMNVFPNPSEGWLFVDYAQAKSISIMNSVGAIVFDEKQVYNVNGLKSIDVSTFKSGIYLVKVSNAYGTVTQKVFINP